MKPRWFQNGSWFFEIYFGLLELYTWTSTRVIKQSKRLLRLKSLLSERKQRLSFSHLTFQIWVFILGPLFHGVHAFRKPWFQISRSTTSKSTASLATMVLASWVSGRDGKSKWWPYSCCHPYFQQWWPYSCWGSNNANLCMAILRIISLIVHCLGW